MTIKYQRGFTLIELIVSLLLGLILVAGIGELFVQSQKSYRAQHSLAIMMEDGSYVLEVLSKELRQTGFLRNNKSIGGSALEVFQEDFDTLGSGQMNASIDLDREEYIHGINDDAFAFRYQLKDAEDLGAVNGSSNSPCTLELSLEGTEDPAIDIHVVTVYFYVAMDYQLGLPTLYCRAKREVIDNASVPPATCAVDDCDSPGGLPLISNVERLVVRYGVQEDPNNTPNDGTDDAYYYTSANEITDWKKVISAKLFVVMRSEDDNLMRNPMTYSIEDTSYTPMDKRFYRVFSTTVALRNSIMRK